MMQRIINTMFHGTVKAKLFLWSIFIMILATIGLTVFAAALGSYVFGAGAAACGVAAFITSQSASLEQLNRKKPASVPKAGREKRDKASHTGTDKEEAETGGMVNSADRKEKAQAKAAYIASMNEKKLKQAMKEHKVRQKHVFLLIDSYPEEQLEYTPAVMWRTDTQLHILALEGSALEFAIPLHEVTGILFQPNQPADPERDYPTFRYSSFVTKLYTPYLPTYHELAREGELRYTKNLFQIRPGISVTNTSVRNVMEVLPNIPFLVDDKVNNSTYFDEYFKEIYRYSLLCKNTVITLEEYHRSTEKVLQGMLQLPPKAFVRSLQEMKKYHLVTSEYVTKYSQLYRQKRELK